MIKILKEVIHNNYSSVQKPRKVSLIFKLFYNYSNKNIFSLSIDDNIFVSKKIFTIMI